MMGRQCTVCGHPQRAEIDAALLDPSQSLQDVAKHYGLSKAALQRHKAAHLPAHLAQATAAATVLSADKLLGDLAGLQAKALEILGKAEKAGDLRAALAGIREARGCIETAARIFEASEIERRLAEVERVQSEARQ